MIRRISYKNIDFKKYTYCIENSVQKNFYAEKDNLDLLCEAWEILVDGDYDFVMPVPLKRKLGFKLVLMPLFCQQLGVFGAEKNNAKEQEFLDFLRKKYTVFSYAFNFHNSFVSEIKMKKNYVILPVDYAVLRKSYFKGRKSTVKTAQYLHFKEVKRTDVLDFIKNHFKGLEKPGDVARFFSYIDFLEQNSRLKIFGSFRENDLTNLAVIISSKDKYSLLGLINDGRFKTDNGASFLIDRILKENIAAKTFDFMGGNIRGIELFFKSFGSQLQPYPILETSKRDLVKNFFKK
ncbi:hypothetical protein [Kaistella palustris]|uniref:hypothetical protein n=1 Tax=Kaistella palustris TaxID=493376 RepID=UPI00041BCC96|nr:hypothetical protein [Kaistella palustris]